FESVLGCFYFAKRKTGTSRAGRFHPLIREVGNVPRPPKAPGEPPNPPFTPRRSGRRKAAPPFRLRQDAAGRVSTPFPAARRSSLPCGNGNDDWQKSASFHTKRPPSLPARWP